MDVWQVWAVRQQRIVTKRDDIGKRVLETLDLGSELLTETSDRAEAEIAFWRQISIANVKKTPEGGLSRLGDIFFTSLDDPNWTRSAGKTFGFLLCRKGSFEALAAIEAVQP